MSAESLSYVEDHEGYSQLTSFVEVHGAVSEVTLTVPHQGLARPEVIDLFNGYGAFKKTMKPLAVALANEGLASVHSAPIRGSNRSPFEDIIDATGIHLDTHRAIADFLGSNKQIADLNNGTQLSMSKRTNAGQSYGGEIAAQDAEAHPDEVDNLVLMVSVGLERARRARFAKRVGPFGKGELFPFISHHGPNYDLHDGWLALEHMFANPFQSIGEAYACNKSELWRRLPAIAHSIGVAVLAGSKDKLTPAGPMHKYAKPFVHHFDVMPVGHLGVQQYPDIVSYYVGDALEHLDHRHDPNLDLHDNPDLMAS